MKKIQPIKLLIGTGILIMIIGAILYISNFLGIYEVASECGTNEVCGVDEGDNRLERLADGRVAGQIIMAMGCGIFLTALWLKTKSSYRS